MPSCENNTIDGAAVEHQTKEMTDTAAITRSIPPKELQELMQYPKWLTRLTTLGYDPQTLEELADWIQDLKILRKKMEWQTRRAIQEWTPWLGTFPYECRKRYLEDAGLRIHSLSYFEWKIALERAKTIKLSEVAEVRGNKTICPFHDDTRPSLHVFQDGHGYCFVCCRSVNAINYVMATRSMTLREAVLSLANNHLTSNDTSASIV